MPGGARMGGGFGDAARYGRSVAGPDGWWDWAGSVGIGEAFHDLFHILRPVARDDHDVVAVCDDDEAGDSDHRQPLAGIDAQIIALGIDREDRSEEHTSELQSLMRISYAVFCLKKKTEEQYTVYLHE